MIIMYMTLYWHCFKDVLTTGIWEELNEFTDPELKRLAEAIPEAVLGSRAGSTTTKYLGAFRRWKAWAKSHKLPVFPVKAAHLVVYLQYISETTKSKAAVDLVFNAIAWVHSIGGKSSPTKEAFVVATLKGLQRKHAKPVIKKKPFTTDMLRAIAEDVMKTRSLSDLRLGTACLLAYSAFLRFDELSRIRPADITFNESWISIRIDKSKMDQLRKGEEVIVAKTGSSLCPVAMLELYMAQAGIQRTDKSFLFRQITKSRKGERLKAGGSLSYTRLRECLKEKLVQLGYQAPQFGLHSLRAGGATAAANAKVPDRLFRRHGRWKTEIAKDGYVEDSLEARLSVSNSLGL